MYFVFDEGFDFCGEIGVVFFLISAEDAGVHYNCVEVFMIGVLYL